MKGRWRFVLGVACCVLLGLGSGMPTNTLPSLPPEVAQLLPHAVTLWEATVLNFSEIRFLDVGDVNGDGFPDIVGSREQEVVALFGDGAGRFKTGAWAYYEEGERTPLEYGYWVHPIGRFFALAGTLADLDGDGHLDLVVSVVAREEGDVPKLYVFRNTGDGGFTKTWSRLVPFKAHYLWVGDFDGDGRGDLVAATWGEKPTRTFILPGEHGMRFGEPALVATMDGQPFLLADFNADSIPDLGFCDREGVTMLLGDGRGGFSTELAFSPLGVEVEACAAGDLNGDRLLDVVVLTRDGIVVALQESWGFAERAHYALRLKARGVHLCDLDGDGALDLLLEDLYGQRLAVLPGDGRGGFLELASELALVPNRVVRPVDLNRDGRADLLVDMGYFLSVLMNGGNLRGETRLPINGSQLLAIGDLDGNTGPDLIAKSATGIEVLWSNAQGAFIRRPLVTEFPKPGPGAILVRRGDREVEMVEEQGRRFWLERLEAVAAAVAGQTLYVLLSRVEVEDWVRTERTVAELRGFSAVGEETMSLRLDETVVPLLATGDLDGDGKHDVVAATTREIVILWGGEEIRTYSWEEGEVALFCAGDFQGADKDSLALVSVGTYAELYTVSFSGREMVKGPPDLQFAAEAVPLALAYGDLDGDGLPDPVVAAITLSAIREGKEVRIGVSGALLGMALSQHGTRIYTIPQFPVGDAPWPFTGLAVGDFTGDGIGDVAYSKMSGSGVAILPGNGDGSFRQATLVWTEVGPLFSADLDRSGGAELLGSTLGFNPTIWVLWNGGGR